MTALPVRISDPCKTTDRVVEEALHWAGRLPPAGGTALPVLRTEPASGLGPHGRVSAIAGGAL